jgi:hypothetical protein
MTIAFESTDFVHLMSYCEEEGPSTFMLRMNEMGIRIVSTERCSDPQEHFITKLEGNETNMLNFLREFNIHKNDWMVLRYDAPETTDDQHVEELDNGGLVLFL